MKRLCFAWAGIVEGRIHVNKVSDNYCAIGEECRELAVFANKRQAQARYEKIVRVAISAMPIRKRKARKRRRRA